MNGGTTVLVRDVLQRLDLGNSVAEHDTALERYFVETAAFRSLIRDEVDVIAGDKGTGKTALFRILQERYRELPELHNVEILPAFNPQGSPVFQRLAEGEVLTDGQYGTIWKAYIFALVGNWALNCALGDLTPDMKRLEVLLDSVGLRTSDDSPNTVFSNLVNLIRRITNPRAVSAVITIAPNGMPIIAPRLELGTYRHSRSRRTSWTMTKLSASLIE